MKLYYFRNITNNTIKITYHNANAELDNGADDNGKT